MRSWSNQKKLLSQLRRRSDSQAAADPEAESLREAPGAIAIVVDRGATVGLITALELAGYADRYSA